MFYAQKEILLDQQLPTKPSTGWEAVRVEIVSFSMILIPYLTCFINDKNIKDWRVESTRDAIHS